MDSSALGKLLRSKSPKAQLAGCIIALLMFAPDVFRVIGDESLTVWQRLEQVSIAAGQTLFTVAVAAFPAEIITGAITGEIKTEEEELSE